VRRTVRRPPALVPGRRSLVKQRSEAPHLFPSPSLSRDESEGFPSRCIDQWQILPGWGMEGQGSFPPTDHQMARWAHPGIVRPVLSLAWQNARIPWESHETKRAQGYAMWPMRGFSGVGRTLRPWRKLPRW